jgi:hypothetical protein
MSNPKSDTWSNLLQSDETVRAKEGPTAWDKVASALAGVANFATGFAAEQIHAGTSEFVSIALLGQNVSHEPAKAPEPDREKDNAKDMELDR